MASVIDNHKDKKLYGEYLLNQLILDAWKYGIIKELKIAREDLIDILKEHGWVYDDKGHYWCKKEKRTDYLF